MSDDRHNNRGLDPASHEGQAIAALRRLPRARASAGAKVKARQAFLADDADRSMWSNPISFLAPVALLAAALAVLIIGYMPAEQWVVLDVIEPGGVATPAGADLAVGTRLRSGILTTAAGSELELQLGDQLRFRLQPGTRIKLPKAPGRWFKSNRELFLANGEIYGTTGGQRLDFPIRFFTDELSATLTGTTFAVFRTDSASCVCLWEGGITVVPAAEVESAVHLEAGQRVWVYRDDRSPAVLPLNDMEIMKLQMTNDAGIAAPLPDQPGQ